MSETIVRKQNLSTNEKIYIHSVDANGNRQYATPYDVAAASRVLVLPDYTSLRSLQNYAHDIVIIDNWTYIGPDGNTYTTIGGVFRKVTSGTENGGTVIVGNYIWKREFDEITTIPDWWECGGYDQNGNASAIYNDADRLNAAFNYKDNLANLGYESGRKVELLYREYVIDNNINAGIDFTLIGNNATIKRANSPTPLTTQALTVGSNIINVASTAGFRKGNIIMIQDVTNSKGNNPFYGGKGYQEYESADYAKIVSLTATTITINRPLVTALPAGSVVIRDNGLLDSNLDLGNVLIDGVKFDGNKNNGGNTYKFCAGNPHAYGVSLIARSEYSVIRNCIFKDSPAESIYMSRGTIENCTFLNLNGSCVHMAAGYDNAWHPQETKSSLKFFNNYVDGVCLSDVAENTHNEGAFTHSSQSYNIVVSNNTFKNGGTTVFGQTGCGNINCIYSNNVCENFEGIIYLSINNQEEQFEKLLIDNNHFDRCGDISFSNSAPDVRKGKGFALININNNTIKDGRIYLGNISHASVTNNKLVFNTNFHVPFASKMNNYPNYSFVKPYVELMQSAIYAVGTDIEISKNTIENFVENSTELTRGIWVNCEELGSLKKADGSDSKYLFSQNINISDNLIKGFNRGIFTGLYHYSLSGLGSKSILNSKITGNEIFVPENTSADPSFGIMSIAGFSVNSNKIYRIGGTGVQYGILAYGIHINESNLLGSIVSDNFIFGASIGFDIHVGDPGAYFDYNCIIKNNITMRPIFNNPAKSYAGGNELLSTLLPNLTSFEQGEVNFFNLRKNLY